MQRETDQVGVMDEDVPFDLAATVAVTGVVEFYGLLRARIAPQVAGESG